MKRKSVLGLILFAGLITSALFFSADYLVRQGNSHEGETNRTYAAEEKNADGKEAHSKEGTVSINGVEEVKVPELVADSFEPENPEEADNHDLETYDNSSDSSNNGTSIEIVDNSSISLVTEEPWLSSNPSDAGFIAEEPVQIQGDTSSIQEQSTSTDDVLSANIKSEGDEANAGTEPKAPLETAETSVGTLAGPQLIYDSRTVDYYSYIPETQYDKDLAVALDIKNPKISVDAEAAILFDAKTKKPLFHKNPVMAEFPASTSKLLTAIVALENCSLEDVVTIGDEITMIASDSTTAGIRQGQQLTIRNLLEGMLLPSGNDAAYSIAVHIGRKALGNSSACKEEAVDKFISIMNEHAKKLGVKNSSFKTPDGYDAIGQYTTAYDMGLIGIAAIGYDTITEICQKSRSRNIFVSGEDVTWESTNKLITRYSGQYFSSAIGLKTGTSTMAGRCLVAAARRDGKEVVCVIMDSSASGRWEDAIALLEYGLSK